MKLSTGVMLALRTLVNIIIPTYYLTHVFLFIAIPPGSEDAGGVDILQVDDRCLHADAVQLGRSGVGHQVGGTCEEFVVTCSCTYSY